MKMARSQTISFSGNWNQKDLYPSYCAYMLRKKKSKKTEYDRVKQRINLT